MEQNCHLFEGGNFAFKKKFVEMSKAPARFAWGKRKAQRLRPSLGAREPGLRARPRDGEARLVGDEP
jgi:hypothetical protein